VHLGFIRIVEVLKECRVKTEHAVDMLLGFYFSFLIPCNLVSRFMKTVPRLGVHWEAEAPFMCSLQFAVVKSWK